MRREGARWRDTRHACMHAHRAKAGAYCWLPLHPQAGWVPEVGYAFQIRSGEPFALTSFALSLLLVFR